jgi:hypothetical protein
VGKLGAVDLLEVVEDVADGNAVGVEADHHVIEPARDPAARLGTSSGSNVPARSRGTCSGTGPTQVGTVLKMLPTVP